MRKVAICGLAPSYKLAPWRDNEWETWSLAWGHEFIHHSSKVFEIHDPCCLSDDHKEGLAEIDNLVTQETYPLDDIISKYRDYFSCSADYMLALAAYELNEGDQVGMWGIDASDKDHRHQRCNLEYWIGVVEATTGNRIVFPDTCPLVKYEKPDFIEWDWKKRYGYF